ncbi:hypothetical protein [Priestia abyssalis]|uniref:hypothetical protein n=1 Tax=Priestia abyssalis TaxID=1221450 RepID=UPI001115C239|nr:hypothetical protein [Priestia abyssalis]
MELMTMYMVTSSKKITVISAKRTWRKNEKRSCPFFAFFVMYSAIIEAGKPYRKFPIKAYVKTKGRTPNATNASKMVSPILKM